MNLSQFTDREIDAQLDSINAKIAWIVASVHRFITASEIELRDALQAEQLKRCEARRFRKVFDIALENVDTTPPKHIKI